MRYQLFHGILGFQEISGVLRSIKVLRDIRGFKESYDFNCYQCFVGFIINTYDSQNNVFPDNDKF